MIETLVPASACAEMFSDAPESTMFSNEAAVVANAVAERRREFGTVRYCARKALLQIGVPAVPILPDGDGAPGWPAGVVGRHDALPLADAYPDLNWDRILFCAKGAVYKRGSRDPAVARLRGRVDDGVPGRHVLGARARPGLAHRGR